MENWKCAICNEKLKSPVVTTCGHAFCWRCLNEYMKNNIKCPLCQTKFEKSSFTAIFGHGIEDPNIEDLPPPPKQDEMDYEPPKPNDNNNFQEQPYQRPWNNNNFQFQHGNVEFGIGFVPFGMGMTFGTIGGINHHYRTFPNNNINNIPQNQNGLKKILIIILIFILFHFLTVFL